MAYTAIFSSGKTLNTLKQFVVDTQAEMSEIDVSQLSPGSTARVIETGVTYILNHKYKWVNDIDRPVPPQPGDIYVYDGGEIV